MSSAISDADLVVIYQFDFDVKKDNNKLGVDEDCLSGTFSSLPGGDCWELKLTRMDVNCESEFNCELRLNDSRSDWKLCRIGVVCEKLSEGRQIPFRNATEEAVVFAAGQEFSLGTFNIDKYSWQVRVEVLKYIEGLPIRSFELPDSMLYDDCLKRFKNEEFGDVTIVAADLRKFRCHRDILARRSEVFRQMFDSARIEAEKHMVDKDFGENSETPIDLLKIEDFNEEVVAQLLLFVYTDGLGQFGWIADRLSMAADRYQLDRLKIICESTMAEFVSDDNLVKSLLLAERYDLVDVVKKYVDYQAIHKSKEPICAEEPNVKRPIHTVASGVSITSKHLPMRVAPGSILVDKSQLGFNCANWSDLSVGDVSSKIFSHKSNGDRWELRLEKTADNDVRRQLRLLNTFIWATKFAYLTCAKWQNDGENRICLGHNTTPMGLFIRSGDTVEFGLMPCGFVDEITCEIHTIKSHDCAPLISAKFMPRESQLASDLLKWFEEDNFGDVTVVAKDGKKFRCHRDFLARRSEVFRQMFNSARNGAAKHMVDKTSETPIDADLLNIEDFEGEIVAQLILFCYIDECSQIGSIADDLYAAADWYQLDRLKSLCESTMAANLSDQSVVDTYRFARLYHLDKLMAECVDYAECYSDEICIANLLAESVGI